MDKLTSLITRLEKFETDIPEIIKETIESNSHAICEMNTEKQLFEKGIDRTGVTLESYHSYSPRTLEIKQSKGQPTNRVTLRDTGAFHSSFYIEAGIDSFEIKASDPKTDELMHKYSPDILGLTNEDANIVSHEMIKPILIERLNGQNN